MASAMSIAHGDGQHEIVCWDSPLLKYSVRFCEAPCVFWLEGKIGSGGAADAQVPACKEQREPERGLMKGGLQRSCATPSMIMRDPFASPVLSGRL